MTHSDHKLNRVLPCVTVHFDPQPYGGFPRFIITHLESIRASRRSLVSWSCRRAANPQGRPRQGFPERIEWHPWKVDVLNGAPHPKRHKEIQESRNHWLISPHLIWLIDVDRLKKRPSLVGATSLQEPQKNKT